MTLPVALAFAALQALAAAPAPDTVSDAYLDPAARTLVAEARAHRSLVDARIERYRVLSRTRTTVGLRALRRDRMLYRCEAAAEVSWTRTDTIRIEFIAAREVVPLIHGEAEAGDGECGGGHFDPAGDRLGLALGGSMSLSDSSFFHHPLAPGSERDYRFRSGGTTSMRLADGTMIRLRELEVLPRRSEPTLVSGSLWLEDRSHAVVRAVMRLARAFDYDRDRDLVDDDDNDGKADDDGEVPRILRPIRADIRYVSIEYGLWEQQWWLPRLIAFEGDAQVGRLLGVPLKIERTYSDYEITALPPGAPIPPAVVAPPDSVCGRGDGADADSTAERSGTRGEARRARHGCECTEGRCRVVVTTMNPDSVELVRSELLPESIFEEGHAFVTDREMRDILERVGSGPRPPWQVSDVDWRSGWSALDLVRYNRVEGLSLGLGANLDLGRAVVDGTVRIGLADLSPNAEIAASRGGAVSRYRLAGYRRLDAVGPAPRALGLGTTFTSLFLGRDDGDYFRTMGLELRREPASGDMGLSWRLFAEAQRAAAKKTDFHLAGTPGETSFRPNIAADAAEQVGLDFSVRAGRGLNPAGWRGRVTAGALASAGTYAFLQPHLTFSGAAPLPAGLLAGVEVNGGTTFGDAPLQSLYFLGGPSTVRGYGGDAARGDSYWTARGEVGTAGPAVRVIGFSDLGWAGVADEVTADPLLLSVGGGVSFLDGLIRLDLARALRNGSAWRLEMQVDAGL